MRAFFSGVRETTAFIFAGDTVGFIVRPLGALIFGRLGDHQAQVHVLARRLSALDVTTNVLPDSVAIGIAAPLLLVTLRVLQGLAIGGEFSGAIVYVAEHAPAGQRGLHTSCIPAMAMAGLLLSLLVIAATRAAMTPETFADWGWRVPFLVSVVLLGISLWIRLRLHESPLFQADAGRAEVPRAPIAETFLKRENGARVRGALWCSDRAAIIFTWERFTRTTSSSGADAFTVTVAAVALDRGAARAFCAAGSATA